MSFYVICVCFSFWSLAAKCFHETLGEAFLSHPHCLYMISFHLSHFQQRRTIYTHYKPYFIATTTVTDMKTSSRDCLCVFIWSCSGIYWPFSAVGHTRWKMNTTTQPSKYLVQLLWQVTNQAALCLIQHCACWKTESCGWNSETINLTVGKTSQGKESWTQRKHTFFVRKWAQAASCVLGKLHLPLYYLCLLKANARI